VTRVVVEMEKLSNLTTGLGQFCLHLGTALTRLSDDLAEPTFYVPRDRVGALGPAARYRTSSSLHRLFRAPSAGVDVWHATHQQSRVLPRDGATRLLVTIHDLNVLTKYAGRRQRSRLAGVQRLVDRASGVAVVSNYTGEIAREHLRLGDIPVRVIPNGNSLTPVERPARPPFAPSGDFVLAIGVLNPRKNFASLLALLDGTALTLVIAGDDHHACASEIRREAAARGVAERLVMPGSVDDAARYWLYANCLALVFPSVAEGFGLPVVEAMSLGKPVFLAERASLPEIGGPEGYYWTNFMPEHMRDVFERGMRDLRADPDKPARLRAWAARFSWDAAARQYVRFYADLAESPRP
jgi:glycosyltransferase involved in cell wall biosynthesis